jgi:RHS repeat-associated protein
MWFDQLLYGQSCGSLMDHRSATEGNVVLTVVGFSSNGVNFTVGESGPTVYYYIEDSLGTSRVTTTSTGVVCYDADFAPFGQENALTLNCTQNNYKFEGKERDSETSNDEFGARYYSWRWGRWLSADWSSVPVPVPYANLTNPQTLNLYAMVADDPESFADLDGHQNQGGSSEAIPCNPLTGAGCSGQPASDAELTTGQTNQANAATQNEEQDRPVCWCAGGTGFWSHASNLLHGHSWNYDMRESVTVRILSSKPNPYVTAAADTLAVAAEATGRKLLGSLGALLSLANDQSPVNVTMTVGSFVPVAGEAVGAVGIVYDVGDLAGHFITNNVMAPMLAAAPPEKIDDSNGHLIPNPAQADECQALGGCN